MGNCTSCFSSRPQNPGVLLLDMGGNLRRRVGLPVTAAELMLEEPFHAVVPLDELRRTRRVLPMRADEELADGKAYVVVPLERVNSKVPETVMEALEDAALHKRRRRRPMNLNGPRVSPAEEGEKVEKENRLDWVSGGRDGDLTSQPMANGRNYWRPVLETISEIA